MKLSKLKAKAEYLSGYNLGRESMKLYFTFSKKIFIILNNHS